MNYQECVEFLYQRLPFYQKDGQKALKYGLDNIQSLADQLGDPHLTFPSIHVAGTNGKGSSCHALAAVLQTHGWKTGLYTSPHLLDYRERIKIDGAPVSEDYVVQFVEGNMPLIDQIQPTFFEITAAMAFDYFAINNVDIAVIEVGMGGRLDSTNILVPLISLITNIGYDHQAVLGNNLQDIAREKAGIIKPGIPVVIGERHPDTEEVFGEIATSMNSRCIQAQDNFKLQVIHTEPQLALRVYHHGDLRWERLVMDLTGPYQVRNVPGILQTLDELEKTGFNCADDLIEAGMSSVVRSTGLMGRWQKLSDNPMIICDTGHNREAMELIVSRLVNQNQARLHLVLGMSKDKEHRKILELMPADASYYFCSSSVPRVLDAVSLQAIARDMGITGRAVEDPVEALARAKASANAEDLIFVGGSSFVVADILKSYEKKAREV